MMILAIIFYVSLFLYSLSILFYFLGLFKLKSNRSGRSPFVSVILPVKNEKDYIESILYSVTHQTYLKDNYEVIIVDDESTDITPNVCRAYVEKYRNVKLLSTGGIESQYRYKKKPLDIGIKEAKGDIILLTDADCHVSSAWIETMVSYFTQNVGMVVGYSELAPFETVGEKVQSLDFLMLMSAARGSTQLGLPYACTGQNLAYRKTVFEEVGGFKSVADRVGGDDTLLLQQIKKKTNWDIVFAIDSGSYVSSDPLHAFKQFITQRIRWSADTIPVKNTDRLFFSIIIITYLVNLTPILLAFSIYFTGYGFLPLLKGLLFKFIIEGILMVKGTAVFHRKELRPIFPIWFIFQIPYVTMMGILSFIGNRFSWGGRL